MLDNLSPSALCAEPLRWPNLEERFLPPRNFVWGTFIAADGAELRWGYLPVAGARAQCVLVGGFGEFIEKQFETVRDLAASKIEVWCFDWRGQGRSTRPRRLPHRPRARNFDRDAADLAAFATATLTAPLPRLLIAHSMGGAIALLCLHQHPELFAAAILSSPMLGLRILGLAPALLRCITAPARAAGLEHCLVPGARRWRATRQLPEHSHLSRDEERCLQRHAWVAADPSLHVDEPTYGWLDSALALLPRIQNSEFLQGVRAPILIGTPEYDSVVSPEAQLRAADLLPNCTLVELAGSRHDPFLEGDCIRDDWLHHIERFLVERLGSDAMRNRLPDYQLRTGSCTRQAA